MCRACPRLYFAVLFPDTSVDRELYMQIFLWNTDLRSLIKHHTFKKRQLGVCLAWSLLLLLSHFSRVRLLATPWTAAHQAPRSLGFSRQEHGSGLPCPSPMRESEVAQSCPTLRDPMDCSPPGSSVHGIFQAPVLEWGAVAFSEHGA